jgi:ferredoxin
MVVVDEERCVGCGQCVTFCPQDALKAWVIVEVDENKCSDCFGGEYNSKENRRTKTRRIPFCVENCPVEALSVKEEV